MAHTAAMGPPLSPRETRRSGRRSAPSASASTSKSPDSPPSEPPPRPKENSSRPSLSSSNSSGRTKRLKQEELDDTVEDSYKATQTSTVAPPHGNTNGRAKRKGKEKEKPTTLPDLVVEPIPHKSSASVVDGSVGQPDEEDQGITRCVCGLNEEDADGGEFMVQCETCNCWQHGLCMGYQNEDQLQNDDYYCETCRPNLHQDLLKKLSKKVRHSSTTSHNASAVVVPRLSRSHSPSHLLKPAKRRNTMNSRDAAFDESLKELIEATAAEAAAVPDAESPVAEGMANGHPGLQEEQDAGPIGRKKRKRTDDDALPKKRTRSASSASDHPPPPNPITEDVPAKPNPGPSVSSKSNNARNRRGGRKTATTNQEVVMSVEGEEVPGPSKRPQNSRSKIAPTPKRAPPSHASLVSGGTGHDLGTTGRRNHSSGANGSNTSTSAENSRAYRNSHAYAVSQQPLFTSWNLPDYLAHLEPMLPTGVPRPLEVRGSGIGAGGRESMERTMERGVKVKWPSKRMSVGDMNKRVRALVEWVGREQASALDRDRRREALEKAFMLGIRVDQSRGSTGSISRGANGLYEVEGGESDQRPDVMIISSDKVDSPAVERISVDLHEIAIGDGGYGHKPRSSTMKMMEELMEELILFQERFGPGAKSKERERRLVS